MKHTAPHHAKFRRLVRLIRDRVNTSTITVETVCVGILERLWHATIVNAQQGDIGKLENVDIAEAVGWTGDADELIECLVKTGWLDESGKHRLIVHDWHDHCPTFLKGNLTRYDRQFFSDPQKQEPNLTQPNLTSKQAAKQPAKQTLVAPSVEEIQTYADQYAASQTKTGKKWPQRKFDADQFHDHYAANGWKQSNGNRLACWKAAVRNWGRNTKFGDSDTATSAYKDLTKTEIP